MIFKTAEWGYGVKGAVKKNTWYGKRHTAVHNTQHKKHKKKQWKIHPKKILKYKSKYCGIRIICHFYGILTFKDFVVKVLPQIKRVHQTTSFLYNYMLN